MWIGERLLVCEPASSTAKVYSFRLYSPSSATWTPLEFTACSDLFDIVVNEDDELIFVELDKEKRSKGNKQRVQTYRLPARYAFYSALNFKMIVVVFYNICRLPETLVSLAWTAVQTRTVGEEEFLEKTLACLPPNIGIRRLFAEDS